MLLSLFIHCILMFIMVSPQTYWWSTLMTVDVLLTWMQCVCVLGSCPTLNTLPAFVFINTSLGDMTWSVCPCDLRTEQMLLSALHTQTPQHKYFVVNPIPRAKEWWLKWSSHSPTAHVLKTAKLKIEKLWLDKQSEAQLHNMNLV